MGALRLAGVTRVSDVTLRRTGESTRDKEEVAPHRFGFRGHDSWATRIRSSAETYDPTAPTGGPVRQVRWRRIPADGRSSRGCFSVPPSTRQGRSTPFPWLARQAAGT